jgi:hypothetical protein
MIVSNIPPKEVAGISTSSNSDYFELGFLSISMKSYFNHSCVLEQ